MVVSALTIDAQHFQASAESQAVSVLRRDVRARPSADGAPKPPSAFGANAPTLYDRSPPNGAAWTAFAAGSRTVAPSSEAARPTTTRTLTGTHWASPADFPALKAAGYDFAVVTVPPTDKARLDAVLDAAHQNGLKLFVGAQPYPFEHVGNELRLTSDGKQFLKNLSARKDDVMGVWVSNEPFWTDPLRPSVNSEKGVYTAKQLSDLANQIRAVYPDAKIMQDIGAPSAWAPGGKMHTGDKYPIDQLKGVADYWGIFGDGAEPFKAGGAYNKQGALDKIEHEVKFVEQTLGGRAIVDAQSYYAPSATITGYPSDAQIKDFNCALRQRMPELSGISWYVWRQAPLYQDFLANHPSQVPLTGPNVCRVP
jgi:hypothetical protein